MLLHALALGLAILLASPLAGQDREGMVAQGKQVFTALGCYGCHTLGIVGTPIAPDLSRVGLRYRESDFVRWLADPSAQEPTRHMPKIQLSGAELRALAAFLASLT